MTDQVISDLKDTKRDIESKFKGWFKFAIGMAASVGMDLGEPRTAKCWCRFRGNVPSIDGESYYRRSIAIPVMDNFINSFRRQNG